MYLLIILLTIEYKTLFSYTLLDILCKRLLLIGRMPECRRQKGFTSVHRAMTVQLLNNHLASQLARYFYHLNASVINATKIGKQSYRSNKNSRNNAVCHWCLPHTVRTHTRFELASVFSVLFTPHAVIFDHSLSSHYGQCRRFRSFFFFWEIFKTPHYQYYVIMTYVN